jgi:hypothetical protein
MDKDTTNNNANKTAISGWEDEGGAGRSDERPVGVTEHSRADARQRLDASHESDARGEHRYPDTHQTAAEQSARQNRDDLKRRMSGGAAAGSGQGVPK